MNPYNDPPAHIFRAKKPGSAASISSAVPDEHTKETITANIDALITECRQSEVTTPQSLLEDRKER
jgi:hypothetical protein